MNWKKSGFRRSGEGWLPIYESIYSMVCLEQKVETTKQSKN
jgi:hypothetical protein